MSSTVRAASWRAARAASSARRPSGRSRRRPICERPTPTMATWFCSSNTDRPIQSELQQINILEAVEGGNHGKADIELVEVELSHQIGRDQNGRLFVDLHRHDYVRKILLEARYPRLPGNGVGVDGPSPTDLGPGERFPAAIRADHESPLGVVAARLAA